MANEHVKRISKIVIKSYRVSMNIYYSSNLSNMQNDARKTWQIINGTIFRKTDRIFLFEDSSKEIVIVAERFNN